MNVNSVAFGVQGTALFSGHSDGTLKRWDTLSGRLVWSCAQSHHIIALACPARGSHLLIAGEGTYSLCDMVTGKSLRSWRGSEVRAGGLALSPDGKLAAAGQTRPGGQVLLWDVMTGSLTRTLDAQRAGAWAVAFSPDGKQLLGTGSDGEARFWEVASGNLLRTKSLNARGLYPLALSHDLRLGICGAGGLAASGRQSMLLWEVAGHRAACRLQGFRGHVHALAFSPDGKQALAVGTLTDESPAGQPDPQLLLAWDVVSGNLAGSIALTKATD